jgi:hypothetical protein
MKNKEEVYKKLDRRPFYLIIITVLLTAFSPDYYTVYKLTNDEKLSTLYNSFINYLPIIFVCLLVLCLYITFNTMNHNQNIEIFVSKYLKGLTEEETTTQISEIANAQFHHSLSEQKTAQYLLKLETKLNPA